MRRILIFSEMFPKLYNRSSGIFVMKRVEKLLELTNKSSPEITIDFAPVSYEDNAFFSFFKMMKGQKPTKIPEYLEISGRKFKAYKVDLSLKDRLQILTGKIGGWVKYAEKIAQVLEDNKNLGEYNLIHAHRVFPEGLAAKILSEKYNIPYIITAHGGEIHSPIVGSQNIIVDVLEHASVSIFVSNFLKNKAISIGYSGKNAVVIPNGFDEKIFYPRNKETVRKDLKIYKPDYKYVGFVGNLNYVKRADELPFIFKEIKKNYKNVIFIVVGDGPYMRYIKKNTKELEIIFTGRIPHEQVALWMSAMDVMILPSRNEGWPCVVLEAQACGTCVVGSDAGGIPEAIGFDEYVVKNKENFETRLTNKIADVLKTGCDEGEIFKRIKNFTWDKVIKKEISITLDIL